MLWINFIHLYQPANTNSEYIIQAAENSYKRILRALQKNNNTRFTININGCLIERLLELGYKDLIADFKKLAEEGRIEIVSTAAYHPVLPLLPKVEVVKQIKKQEKILKKYLGIKKRPNGFFLPEMAYSPEISRVIHALGYKWIIIDEIARTGKIDETDISKVYKDINSGLKVVFRSNLILMFLVF
jgi:alpha-amylase/alpha-mannosidase (GH57 family)